MAAHSVAIQTKDEAASTDRRYEMNLGWRAVTKAARQACVGRVVHFSRAKMDGRTFALAYTPFVDFHHDDDVLCWREWKYASVTADDLVLMAETKSAVNRLLAAVRMVTPLMHQFGLVGRFTHLYEMDSLAQDDSGKGEDLKGFCLKHHSDTDRMAIVAAYIAVTTDGTLAETVYYLIHELAHLDPEDWGDHDTGFRVRFGEYLGWYLSQSDSSMRRELTNYICDEGGNYYTPYFADDVVDTNEYAADICDEWQVCARVSEIESLEMLQRLLDEKEVA